MYLLEKISSNLAAKIALFLKLDKDREEVLAYGAYNLIHTCWSTFLIVVFGLLSASLPIILIIAFTVAVLRKFSGGAHATSPNRCAAISVIIFGTLSLIIKYTAIYVNYVSVILYQVVSFAFTYIILYKYCPVDTPNKPIKEHELRQKFRRSSFNILFFLVAITVILWIGFLKSYDASILIHMVSICIGMLWQSITLTIIGHSIIGRLDMILQNTSLLMKGGRKT